MSALGQLLRSDVPAERLDVLAAEVAAFLRAGGFVMLDEWDGFSPAGRIAAFRGAQLAEAARGDAVAAAVANVASGALAEARTRSALAAAADEAAAAISEAGGAGA